MDLASSPVFLDAGRVKGSALFVFLTKSKLPMTLAEIKRNNGPRDWDAKFPELERNIAPDQVEDVVRKIHHGYRGEKEVHDAVVRLLDSLQIPSHNLVSYYEHCRSMQRDLGVLAEEDLDYQDLFCDKRREKIFSEEFGFPCTFAAVSDLLRLHPSLMEESWSHTHAPRDADSLWRESTADVDRFAEMLRTDSSLTEEERLRLMPRALVQDRRLYVNYTANFLLIGHCRGPLARNLRIKGAALKALAEVGVSSAVRAVLSRALQEDASGLRGQLDPAADAGSSAWDKKSEVLIKRMDLLSSRGILAVRKSNTKQHRALVRVQTAFEDRVALLETTFHAALHTALSQQEERMLSKLAKQCEQVSVRAIMYGQKIFRSTLLEIMEPALSPLKNLTHNVSMKVRGAVKDVIDAAVTSPDSLLVRSFRSATKGPARRKTLDPLQYPEDQRASDLEQALESLSLAQVAHALCPAMKYPAWKAVRGNFGKACLAERKRRGKYPPDHPLHLPKTLLWSFVGASMNQGGGARRMYLQSQRELVEGVWKKLDKDGSSFHSKAEKESLERSDEPWPVNSAELDPPDFSSL